MKTLTICGSMRFEKKMQEVAFMLETERGYNVLQCVYGKSKSIYEDQIQRLVEAHYKKIDMSDGIFVVNPGGYIQQRLSCNIFRGILI